MESHDLYHYIERLCSLLRTELRRSGNDAGLQPIQTEALNYLARCNRFSDTAMAVTDYLGQTKGTVSQTLKVLEKKGLIEKIPDANDKRVIHLHVTEAGQDYLTQTIPPALFQKLDQHLSPQDQQQIQQAMKTLLTGLQKANGQQRFGQCKQCRYHQKIDQGAVCGLTQQPLQEREWEKICREFEIK
ncbi:MAG: MarR family winged helix-turn-helix transcriptional regulator [bacterium]